MHVIHDFCIRIHLLFQTRIMLPYTCVVRMDAELPDTPGYVFWAKLGCPKTVAAPMVDHSELAFRMQCRRYNTHLVFTQMLHSKVFLTDKHYQTMNFTTCEGDRPLIAQVRSNRTRHAYRNIHTYAHVHSSVATILRPFWKQRD
jgi:hypothetical protein